MRKKIAIIITAVFLANLLLCFGFVSGRFDSVSFEMEKPTLFFKSPLSLILKEKEPEQINEKTSPISGIACENYNKRAFAVMLAGDRETRPLSGLAEAEIIFEMPVVTGGITRLMAVYICNIPEEIGSIRSARHDFIPLAMGLDAIFVHWGGSHFALSILKNKITNNINALSASYGAFYRKKGIPQPHNGFTSKEKLINSANKLKYRTENEFEKYPFQNNNSRIKNNENKKLTLKIGYPYKVEYGYDFENNSYLRWRDGKKEIDKNSGKQISAKNVIIMRAKSRQIEGQYNDVEIEGTGKCEVYNNGIIVKGIWKKDKNNKASKLYFLNEKNKEIKLVPGQTWIQIVEPCQKVEWTEN